MICSLYVLAVIKSSWRFKFQFNKIFRKREKSFNKKVFNCREIPSDLFRILGFRGNFVWKYLRYVRGKFNFSLFYIPFKYIVYIAVVAKFFRFRNEKKVEFIRGHREKRLSQTQATFTFLENFSFCFNRLIAKKYFYSFGFSSPFFFCYSASLSLYINV